MEIIVEREADLDFRGVFEQGTQRLRDAGDAYAEEEAVFRSAELYKRNGV